MMSREVRLKARPEGLPDVNHFEIVERELPPLGPDEVLVQNLFMSVDPYMRGRMNTIWSPGDVLVGGAVGRIAASRNTAFREGDYVQHGSGWREYHVTNGSDLIPVDAARAPLSAFLGVLGMPGLTAWGGLLTIGQYRDGETVFVSAASGAVGSVVGQIVHLRGGVAIGSAGSADKVRTLIDGYHFDHAFNYKEADPLAELRKAAPDGIDIYFENVGGPQLEAALTHMRPWGRIPICGMIAHYNDTERSPGPRNLTETIYKHVTLRGFVVTEFNDQRERFVDEMSGWIREGKLRFRETVYDGIERAPEAFIGLFHGANDGKMLVRLAD
jgi:NADPH-dependent curcumin reductase CurA